MRISVAHDDIRKGFAGTEGQIARAVTAGMRDVTAGLKTDLRQDVVKAGLGQRLANTWRGTAYPETGESMEAAAYASSRAPKLIGAFDRGVTIRSKNGFFLAIPTEFAGKGVGKKSKITPGEWERRTGQRLQFVYRRGAPSLLVAERRLRTGKSAERPGTRFGKASARTRAGLTTVVVFILVPQTRLRKRLDIDGIAQAWAARVPSQIAQHWT